MQQTYRHGLVVLAVSVLAGCASTPPEPTLADAMRGHSYEAQYQAELKRELAKRWERGDELENTGERRVERSREEIEQAEEKIAKARQAIERGNREIAEGREMKAESERRFQRRFPDLSLDPADQDARR